MSPTLKHSHHRLCIIRSGDQGLNRPFLHQKVFHMSYAIARQQVRHDIARARRFLADKLHVPPAGLSRRDLRRFDRLTTHDPRGVALSLARFDVTEAHGLAFTDALLAHWTAHRHVPGFRYWFATFCWDDGVRPLGEYLSLAEAQAMQLKVYKALQKAGFHADIFIEVEGLLPEVVDGPAWLLYHVHAVCWHYGPPIKPRALADEMMRRHSFPNRFGAPSIRFTTNRWRRRPASTNLEPLPARRDRPAPTAISVAGLAAYVTKWPACTKVFKPGRADPTRRRMEADQTKYSAHLVRAVAEARSRLPLLAIVKGLGEGSGVRTAWRRNVEQRLGIR